MKYSGIQTKITIITYISPYFRDVLDMNRIWWWITKILENWFFRNMSTIKKRLTSKKFNQTQESSEWFSLAFMTKNQLYCIVLLTRFPFLKKVNFTDIGSRFNITEIKNLEKLERNSHTLSHELRTPLTAIKESINIVSDGLAGEINKTQKETLEIGKRNIIRLSRII